MSKESSSSGGIDVFGLLGVAFVVLKLTGYIDWSWWYVTLPFWGGAAFVLGVLLIALLFAAVAEMWRRLPWKSRSRSSTPAPRCRPTRRPMLPASTRLAFARLF